jgi:predicted 3-demethylubiquinone-9 3-methyltransferase (glyoxalase superfamily)
MQKISPFLWFDDKAEEAAEFYVSVFSARRGSGSHGESKVLNVSRYGEAGPGPVGTAMTVSFQLEGLEFTALNGGPHHQFTEAISFFVNCESQEEVDELWAALSEGGQEGPCGWLKDRYGLSWQIIPIALTELLSDPDPERSQRAMKAMLDMTKIDIAALRRAAGAA